MAWAGACFRASIMVSMRCASPERYGRERTENAVFFSFLFPIGFCCCDSVSWKNDMVDVLSSDRPCALWLLCLAGERVCTMQKLNVIRCDGGEAIWPTMQPNGNTRVNFQLHALRASVIGNTLTVCPPDAFVSIIRLPFTLFFLPFRNYL